METSVYQMRAAAAKLRVAPTTMEDEKRDASLSHDPIAYMGLGNPADSAVVDFVGTIVLQGRRSGWKRACARRAIASDGGGVLLRDPEPADNQHDFRLDRGRCGDGVRRLRRCGVAIAKIRI